MPEYTNNCRGQNSPQSVVDIVMTISDSKLHRELSNFCADYERVHGLVDLLPRYTSTLSLEAQDWLLENRPKQYFEGLPEFAQAFILAKMEAAKKIGKLDDAPDHYLKLFLRGQLKLTKNSHGI